MNFDFNSLRPFLMVFIAPWTPLFFAWLNHKFGVIYSEEQQRQLVSLAIDFGGFAMIAGIAKVAGNKHVNPGNAASSHLASVEKREAEDIKATTDQYKTMGK